MKAASISTRSRKRFKVNEQHQVADVGFSNTVLYGLTIFPLEIWDKIFSLLLVNPTGITSHDLRRKKVPGVPPVPVMQVCKAWYQRAQFIFYARNDFHFDKVSHMTSSLKRMALDSRRALRSVEVNWGSIWGIERNQISHELTQCTSLQTVRMAGPHMWGVFAIGIDITRSKPFRVFEEMRGLKEVSIRCPGMDMMAQVDASLLGTEPTTVREPQCCQCNRLQAHLEKLVFKPRQEGQNEAVVKTTRKRKLTDPIGTVKKRKPKGQTAVGN